MRKGAVCWLLACCLVTGPALVRDLAGEEGARLDPAEKVPNLGSGWTVRKRPKRSGPVAWRSVAGIKPGGKVSAPRVPAGGGGQSSPCVDCNVGKVGCTETTSGDLAQGDCELEDASRFDVWSLELGEARQLDVRLSSSEFDTFLFLVDDQCNVIASNDDCGPDSTDSCLLSVPLGAGFYFIVANSFAGGEIGRYAIEVGCGDITTCADCGVGTLGCNETVDGVLPTSNCQLADGTHLDIYRFDLPQAAVVSFNLRSAAFDTFLLLLGGDCVPFAVNDDCQEGNFELSCLTLDLPGGTYFVGVNSFSSGESGNYVLEAGCSSRPPGLQLPGDCNQDRLVNISDGICLLGHLFRGEPSALPCGEGSIDEESNGLLFDFDGDAAVNLTDAVALLLHLFRAGGPHVLGTDCIRVESCPDSGCVP